MVPWGCQALTEVPVVVSFHVKVTLHRKESISLFLCCCCFFFTFLLKAAIEPNDFLYLNLNVLPFFFPF